MTVETLVRRHPAVVWDALTDLSSLPGWVEGLVHASATSEVDVGIEIAIEIASARRSGPRGEIVRAVSQITRCRPPSLLVVETRAPELLLLDRVTLEPIREGTRLRLDSEVMHSSRLAELAASPRTLLGGRADHAAQGIYERSVEALVKRVETSGAVPYR